MAAGSKNQSKDAPKDASKDAPKEVGRFAYEGLQRLIHEKARLSILASLASHANGLLFNDLKALCSLTDGNLSRQLQVLQEAGFVEVWKGFKNKRPQTLCRLTPDGRKRFVDYITTLENVVSDAMSAAEAGKAGSPPRSLEAEGFVPA
jgi:DNA-binding HxlR family transcriptional regulator